MEIRRNLKSHLVYGSEYDSVLEWLKKRNAKSFYELGNDNEENEFITKNLFDENLLVDEWTQEKYSKINEVIRGTSIIFFGFSNAFNRFTNLTTPSDLSKIGFRVALYIKHN